MTDEKWAWAPPQRGLASGHRVARPGYKPRQTRSLGIWAILAEIPMRHLARKMGHVTDPEAYWEERS